MTANLILPNILAVAAGGAIGAVLRYLVVLLSTATLGAAFPYGVLAANTFGSFAMGCGMVLLKDHSAAPLILVGLLGAFTTFSSFAADVVRLWESGSQMTSVTYVLLSVSLSVGALLAGLSVARAFS